MEKYRIIGRQKNGTSVIGYILMGTQTEQIVKAGAEEVYSLALNKMIEDVTAQDYNGKIVMKGVKNKISSLPTYDINGKLVQKDAMGNVERPKLMLCGRVIQGKNTVGYKVAVIELGRIVKETIIERHKVMEYAKKGMIQNARCQTSNGEDILRGVNCRISALPTVQR